MRYTKLMSKYSSQSGAAFLYILIAIALIALLSAAMSRGSRTNVTVLTTEQARIAAQEIIDYGSAIATAMQKLRLRGCTDTQISFGNSVFKQHSGSLIHADGHNANAPSDGRCDIFKPSGGNVTAQLIPLSYVYNWTAIGSNNTELGHSRNGRFQIPEVGQEGKEELIFITPYLNENICLKINDLLGVKNPNNYPPILTNTLALYTGGFLDNDTYKLSDPEGVVTGKTAFCMAHPSGQIYDVFFVQVLLAR